MGVGLYFLLYFMVSLNCCLEPRLMASFKHEKSVGPALPQIVPRLVQRRGRNLSWPASHPEVEFHSLLQALPVHNIGQFVMGMAICNGAHKKAPRLEALCGVPGSSRGPAPCSRLCPVLQTAAFLREFRNWQEEVNSEAQA